MNLADPKTYKKKKISIVVFEEAVLTAIAGSLEILMGTNRFLSESGKPEAFDVQLVSNKLKTIQLKMPVQFLCQHTIDEVTNTDLIIVPSFMGPPEPVISKNKEIIQWIRHMNMKGAEVASMCRGSYFLAEAGLLNAKSCTSHWRSVDDMKHKYPEATVLPDVIITDEGGIYTSGGAFSSIHLVLYLIEKFCGRETGIQISKIFSIDMDRISQAHFAVFRGQKEHRDEEILKAQKYIEKHYDAQLSIENLSGMFSMSRRTFIRRFKKATQNTPLEYIQRVRIEAAKKMLERNTMSVSTLLYEVGYNDMKTFRQVFKRYTGLSPVAYQKKYSRSV